jgi:hypothetical protein
MLPNEIEPFANQHIKTLDEVHTLLESITKSFDGPNGTAIGITRQDVAGAKVKVANARQALIRFKICMADEVNQKIRMRDRWLALREKNQE